MGSPETAQDKDLRGYDAGTDRLRRSIMLAKRTLSINQYRDSRNPARGRPTGRQR